MGGLCFGGLLWEVCYGRFMSNRLLCTHPKGRRESLPPPGFHGIPQAVGLRHIEQP